MPGAQRTEIVELSIEKLFQTITDYSNYNKVISGVSCSEIISKQGNISQVKITMNILSPIEYQIKVNENFDAEQGLANVDWVLQKSNFLTKNNGSWSLKSLGAKRTEVTFGLDVDFKSQIPGFVKKGLIKNNLPNTIFEIVDYCKNQ